MPVISSGGAEVTRSSRPGLILLSGVALLGMALAVHGILLETVVWTVVLVGAGVLLSAWGAFALRTELGEVLRRRRGEIALYTLGVLGRAQARRLGVQFAGTAVMESEGRKLQVSGDSETDIANGILRVSRDATQLVCFLAGHGEADPFSLESHDHMEGAPGHTHGLG